jgi:hypothetical protein
MDVIFYVYFLINCIMRMFYICLLAVQGSIIVAIAGSTLSKHLVTILNMRTQHHKLEHLVYIFLQR